MNQLIRFNAHKALANSGRGASEGNQGFYAHRWVSPGWWLRTLGHTWAPPVLCCLPLYLRDSSGANLRGLLGGLDEIMYFEPLAQYLAHKILGQIITEL